MNYWVVRLGHGGEFSKLAKDGNYVAIGWSDLKDLKWLVKTPIHEAKEELKKVLKSTYSNDTSGQRSKASSQISRFVREMQINDFVLTPNSLTRQILIGKIASGYFYEDKKDACRYRHRRKVKWIKEISRDQLSKPLKNSTKALLTVFKLTGHDRELESLLTDKVFKKLPVYASQENEESIVGETINFRGLIFAPINEQGVVFLFSKVSKDLGIELEEIKREFPDAIARVKTAKGYAKRTIEFEYKSSNYDHLPKKANILVCWEHDWTDCPKDIQVIELKDTIKGLDSKE